MYLPVEQRPIMPASPSPLAAPDPSPNAREAEAGARPAEPVLELPKITEELLIEEVSIDGMCGVY